MVLSFPDSKNCSQQSSTVSLMPRGKTSPRWSFLPTNANALFRQVTLEQGSSSNEDKE